MFKESWHYIPEPLLEYVRYTPAREYRRFRSFLDYIRNFARQMIKESQGKGGGKDIMSVLLRGNESPDPKNRLTDSELVDQISCVQGPTWLVILSTHLPVSRSTLLMAGHDTTASSMCWFFHEVCKHPESQDRIRQEIADMRARSTNDEWTTAELDNMTYTQAALKVMAGRVPAICLFTNVLRNTGSIEAPSYLLDTREKS
jgi:cytochrome P450